MRLRGAEETVEQSVARVLEALSSPRRFGRGGGRDPDGEVHRP